MNEIRTILAEQDYPTPRRLDTPSRVHALYELAELRLGDSRMIEQAIDHLSNVELYWLCNALAVMMEYYREHGRAEPHHIQQLAERLRPGMMRAIKSEETE